MYVDESGLIHILYLKNPYPNSIIKDKFFPDSSINIVSLEYMQIKDAKIIERRTLTQTPQGNEDDFAPAFGRFHADASNNLWVIAAGTKKSQYGNFLYNVSGSGVKKQFQRIPLEHPFRNFFTATPRAGSENSDIIDLFGIADDSPNLRYTKIILK